MDDARQGGKADPGFDIEIPDVDPGFDIPDDVREKLATIYKAMALVLAKIIERIQDRPGADNELPGDIADEIAEKLEALKERLESMPRPDNTLPAPEGGAAPKR